MGNFFDHAYIFFNDFIDSLAYALPGLILITWVVLPLIYLLIRIWPLIRK